MSDRHPRAPQNASTGQPVLAARPPADLTRRMATGAGWMVLMRLSHSAVGILSTIILARLLVPGDFGLVAMATAMSVALGLLTTFKFEVALIQNQAAGRAHYDTAWTLNLLLGAALATLLVLLAGPAADFYAEPRVRAIMYVLALGAFVEGFQNIGIVAFQKELTFGREFVFTMTKRLAGFAVTVPLAYALRSYWALAAGILAGTIAGNVASYLMHPYRPRLSLAATGELVRFSRWLLLDNVMWVVRHRSADFIIGRIAGSRELGVFAMAYEIATLVSANLVAPVSRAVFPGYAQMAGDVAVLRAGFLSVAGLMALVTLPSAAGISATAPLFVPLFLGPRWLDTILPIQVVAIGSALSIMLSGASSAYLAAGRPRVLVGLSVAYVLTLVPALLLLVPRHGASGAAWAFLMATMVNMPAQVWLARHVLQVRLTSWLARLWRPITASLLMYLVARGLVSYLPPATGLDGQIAQLVLVVAAAALTYAAAMLALWQLSGRPEGAERSVLSRLGYAAG